MADKKNGVARTCLFYPLIIVNNTKTESHKIWIYCFLCTFTKAKKIKNKNKKNKSTNLGGQRLNFRIGKVTPIQFVFSLLSYW